MVGTLPCPAWMEVHRRPVAGPSLQRWRGHGAGVAWGRPHGSGVHGAGVMKPASHGSLRRRQTGQSADCHRTASLRVPDGWSRAWRGADFRKSRSVQCPLGSGGSWPLARHGGAIEPSRGKVGPSGHAARACGRPALHARGDDDDAAWRCFVLVHHRWVTPGSGAPTLQEQRIRRRRRHREAFEPIGLVGADVRLSIGTRQAVTYYSVLR